MSNTVNLADPRLQERVAERYRQLRSRVDRNRASYEQYTKGELTALSVEARNTMEEFPLWLEDLEELRKGRMPAPRPKATAKTIAAPTTTADAANPNMALETVQVEPVSDIPSLGPVVSKTKKHDSNDAKLGFADACGKGERINRKHDKKVRNAVPPPTEEEKDDEAAEPAEGEAVDAGAIASEEDLIATLRVIRSQTVREELVNAYVDRHMKHQSAATRELVDCEKKLATAEGLKRKIISGAVSRPSNMQLSMIEQLPSLRKQLTAARRRVKKENQTMREALMAKVTAMATDDAQEGEEDDEEDSEEEDVNEGVEDVKEEHKPSASTEMEMIDVGGNNSDVPPAEPEEDNPWAAAVAPTAAAAAAEEEEKELEPAEATNAALSAVPMPGPHPEPEPEPVPEPTAELVPTPEPERQPTPPSPPPPPANITLVRGSDWEELRYTKAGAEHYTLDTFVKLAGPACRKEVEAAAAAATADGRRSSDRSRATRQDADGDGAAATAGEDRVAPSELDASARYVRQHFCIGGYSVSQAKGLNHDSDREKEMGRDGDGGDEQSSAADALPAAWLARIAAELAYLQRHPVPGIAVYAVADRRRMVKEKEGETATAAVAAGARGSDRRWIGAKPTEEMRWHVDVCPSDGPLAGMQVHLTLSFPPAYPFVPPTVQCPVTMPHHGFMVSQSGKANTLFLTYRAHHLTGLVAAAAANGRSRSHGDRSGNGSAIGAACRTPAGHSGTATAVAAAITTGGWLPDMSARVVLEELRGFFSATEFVPTAAALGEERFNQEMATARVALALARARCKACDANREVYGVGGGTDNSTPVGAVCINGPFLVSREAVKSSLGIEETEEEGVVEAEEHEENAVESEKELSTDLRHARRPRAGNGGGGGHRRAPRAVYAGAAGTQDGAIQGPFLGCWAHLLYAPSAAETGGNDSSHGVRVSLAHTTKAGKDRSVAPTAVVEVYRAPSSLLTPLSSKTSGRGGQGGSLAVWAGPLLHSTTANGDDAAPTEKPVWTLPASAWRASKDDNTTTCSLWLTTTEAANVAAEMTVVPLPAARDSNNCTPCAYALLVRVPDKDDQLVFTATRGASFASNASASSAASVGGDNRTNESVTTLWPAAAALANRFLSPPSTAPTSVDGLFVNIPYGFPGVTPEDLRGALGGASGGTSDEADPLASAIRHETYYIPRRATFHLEGDRLPVVASESVFAHYRRLLAGLRRGRPRTRAAAAEQDAFLAVAPEDVVRTHVLGAGTADGGGRGSGRGGSADGGALSTTFAVATLSDYFMGLRVLFLPLAPCPPSELDRFKAACTQLYRNPAASTRYVAPFAPLCTLHLLTLVLQRACVSALEAASADSDANAESAQLARGVVCQILALAGQLIDSDESFRATCEKVATQQQQQTTAATASDAEQRYLFQASPFIPLYILSPPPTAAAMAPTTGEKKAPADSLRARALRYLSYSMGDATEADAAVYEAELDALARVVATGGRGGGAAATGAPRRAKKWVELCAAIVNGA